MIAKIKATQRRTPLTLGFFKLRLIAFARIDRFAHSFALRGTYSRLKLGYQLLAEKHWFGLACV